MSTNVKVRWIELDTEAEAPAPDSVGRPTASLVDGGWLPSSGSDLHAMLNEVEPDDANYIYTGIPTITRMALGAVSLPDGGSRTFRVRAWSPTGNGGLVVRLYQGVTLVATREYGTLSGEPETIVITLTSEEAENLTDGAALEFELESAT